MKYILTLITVAISMTSIFGQTNYLGNSKTVNDSIKAHLENLYWRSMKPRNDLFKAFNEFGRDSEEAKKKEEVLIQTDSILLSEVIAIYESYGWPKLSQVDTVASAWAAIQIIHADVETQRKFLPIFFKAHTYNELLGESWALLVDKLLMMTGETQIYGTQNIGFTYETGERKTIKWPIEDFEIVDELRLSLGMDTIEESMESNGVSYDPEITIDLVKIIR